MKTLLENLRIALTALRSNLMRSLLTALGIIIGVAGVTAVVSIVQGLQHVIAEQFQGVGADYMMIMPQQAQSGPGVVSRKVELDWDDGLALMAQVPGIRYMTPLLVGNQLTKFQEFQHTTLIFGVTEDWQEVNNHTVDLGRFFSEIDRRNRQRVAVIGRKVQEELGLGANPVGKEMYVGNLPATVIGVMEERGQFLGQDVDDLVFIPFDTALLLFGRDAGDAIQIRLKAESPEAVPDVRRAIGRVLRTRHDLEEGEADDFNIIIQDEMLKTVSVILGGVTAVIGGVVSIALLVGGIGIMNIMLVSVTERTKEIGLRKAVGARRRDILLQFLIEAVTLSFAGGLIGLVIGYGMGFLAAKILGSFLDGFPTAYVPVWAIVLAFGFSASVGTFFGFYPAAKAARLDPIEALRYE